MSKVPEFWGRESPYHGNTDFLGTPSDHLEVRRSGKKTKTDTVFSTERKRRKN